MVLSALYTRFFCAKNEGTALSPFLSVAHGRKSRKRVLRNQII